MRTALFLSEDPWLDLSVASDQHRIADQALADLESALPAVVDMPADLVGPYQAMVDAVSAGRSDAVAATDELDTRSDELSPLAADWVAEIEAGADQPPPEEVRALIDASRDAADRLGPGVQHVGGRCRSRRRLLRVLR